MRWHTVGMLCGLQTLQSYYFQNFLMTIPGGLETCRGGQVQEPKCQFSLGEITKGARLRYSSLSLQAFFFYFTINYGIKSKDGLFRIIQFFPLLQKMLPQAQRNLLGSVKPQHLCAECLEEQCEDASKGVFDSIFHVHESRAQTMALDCSVSTSWLLPCASP